MIGPSPEEKRSQIIVFLRFFLDLKDVYNFGEMTAEDLFDVLAAHDSEFSQLADYEFTEVLAKRIQRTIDDAITCGILENQLTSSSSEFQL